MIADRIKALRESNSYTQAALAKRLGITRSSVNAWETGISVPSTQYIIELSRIFNTSTDYLLCIDNTSTLSVEGLTEDDIALVYDMILHLRKLRNE